MEKKVRSAFGFDLQPRRVEHDLGLVEHLRDGRALLTGHALFQPRPAPGLALLHAPLGHDVVNGRATGGGAAALLARQRRQVWDGVVIWVVAAGQLIVEVGVLGLGHGDPDGSGHAHRELGGGVGGGVVVVAERLAAAVTAVLGGAVAAAAVPVSAGLAFRRVGVVAAASAACGVAIVRIGRVARCPDFSVSANVFFALFGFK